MNFVYKIREKNTGLFKVKRCTRTRFDQYGDIYRSEGTARSALAGIIKSGSRTQGELEIVKYVLVEAHIMNNLEKENNVLWHQLHPEDMGR